MTKIKNKKLIYNTINHQYICNYDIWALDETYLTNNIVIALIVNHKTRAILGYCIKTNVNKTSIIKNHLNNKDYKVGCTSDEILELYQLCSTQFNIPKIIHCDLNPTYQGSEIMAFLKENNIELSLSTHMQHGNQTIEAINNVIKTNMLVYLHDKNRRNYKSFRLSWPDNFKNLNKYLRAKKKDFRKFVFSSTYFSTKIDIEEALIGAINSYNSSSNQNYFKNNKSRNELERLNEGIIIETPLKAKNNTEEAIQIIDQNNKTYNNYDKIQKMVLNNTTLSIQQKQNFKDSFVYVQNSRDINIQLKQLYENADENLKPVIETVLLTSSQNLQRSDTIVNLNAELMEKIDYLKTQNDKSTQIITELNKYIKAIEAKEKLKEELTLKRKNRVRRAKTQPFLMKHYKSALYEIEKDTTTSIFCKARLKLMITILILTGIRISELRKLKVSQLLSLLRKGYLTITRDKRGPVNHKAFLSKSGKKLLTDINEDIILVLQQNSIVLPYEKLTTYYVEPYTNLYVFSSEKNKGTKPLTRPYITSFLNSYLQKLPTFIDNELHFTTHSFRHGFITQLWRDSGDLQFVKNIIGHVSIATTSQYADHMTDDQKKQRIEELYDKN